MNFINFNNLEINRDLIYRLFLSFCLIIFIIASADIALAGAVPPSSGGGTTTDDPIGDVFCKLLKLLSGNISKALAVIAMIITSILFMLGQANLQKVLILVAALGVVFGAEHLVGYLSGETDISELCQ